MPESNTLLAALVTGGFGAAVLLLIVALHGTPAQAGRPRRELSEWLRRHRSPQLVARILAGIGVTLVIGIVTRWPVAALGLGAMVAFWPLLTGGARVESSEIARLEALVSWTEALRDTTAAHAGLEQAIPATAANAAPILRPALARLVGHLRTRVPLEDALQDLAEQLDHSADMIVAALINNVHRRGDGLVQVLTGLAAAGREELDLRRRITASRAGDRRAVQLIMLVVVGVAAFLILFSGGSYTRPYSSLGGQVALLIVLALFLCAFLWMRKLAGSRPSARFLPRAGEQLDDTELRIIGALTVGAVTMPDVDARLFRRHR